MHDFNVMLGSYEKSGRAPEIRPYRDFRACIGSCNFMAIPMRGAHYIWCNGRLGSARVESILNRSFFAYNGCFLFLAVN